MRGIPLFCLVFRCAGFGKMGAMWDAAHIKAPCRTRARANSTFQNIRTAFVLLGTVFAQLSTIRCNARALFSIVLNQYNQEQLTLLCFAWFCSVLDQSKEIQSKTIQCNGIQCESPPPALTPPPTPIIIIHSHTEKFVL